jgi:hypothetical protein
MHGAGEAAADGHESPSDTGEDVNEEDVDADGGNVETIEAGDKRERYNALASYEEREKREFELVYRNKGIFHVARGNAAMFQNCAELSDGTSRARYHVIPETVKSVDDNGTRIEPTIHVCSACKRGRRRAFDMAPARTIAAGCDFGRLSVVAPDAVTGESQKFDFNDVSDLEALLFATVRSYQIIAKLVVRQRDARRAHLQGNVISFEQTAESTASSFSCRYDKAAVEAALKHVKIYVVGTADWHCEFEVQHQPGANLASTRSGSRELQRLRRDANLPPDNALRRRRRRRRGGGAHRRSERSAKQVTALLLFLHS